MKIAMFTDTYDKMGGTEQAIRNLTHYLKNRGYDVKIFVTGKNLKNAFYELADFDPDLVHLHTPGPGGNFGLLYAKLKNLPAVAHFHSMPEVRLYFTKRRENKAVIELAWKLAKLFYKGASVVISPSKNIKKLLFEKGIKDNVFVIPYGIDTNLFSTINKKRKSEKNKKITLLYCGWFRRDKRVTMLVDAMQYLGDDYELVLIGNGIEKKKIEKKIKETKANVKLMPPVENKALPEYYSSADIYVNASLSETLGISMIEAMSCELPVVATPSPGALEIIKDGKNGYIASADSPQDIAEKIMKLEDEKKREKLGKSARNFVCENYSIERMGSETEKLYSELL